MSIVDDLKEEIRKGKIEISDFEGEIEDLFLKIKNIEKQKHSFQGYVEGLEYALRQLEEKVCRSSQETNKSTKTEGVK